MKNSTVHNTMMSLENLTSPDYHESKILQKQDLFDDITWTFELALISRWEVKTIHENKAILRHSLENLTCPTIWNFRKNILDLMESFENLNYPIITS